jgi:hypothetical protein
MSERLLPTVIRQRKVQDQNQLLTWWDDLFPELRSDATRRVQSRRFEERDLDAQEAGWVFEHWVCEAFRLVAKEADRVQGPFTVRHDSSDRIEEEVDGMVTLGWQGFLIQSKLESDPTSFDPVARLYLQVGRRPRGTIGLFFSRAYSKAAEELARELRPIRVLLFRTEEIHWALTKESPLDMLEIVRTKWRAALELASPDFPVSKYP